MTTQSKLITYRDYLEGPEIKARKEIVDGVLIMFSGPFRSHQIVSTRIFVPIYMLVTEHELGEVLYAPMDVIIQREPLRVRQPDILFTSNERADILGDRIEGGPDIVVEILSPSNTRQYMQDKLADYAGVGVQECWMVSIEDRNIEVLRLEGGEWRQAHIRGEGELLDSAALPGLELNIAGIFRGI